MGPSVDILRVLDANLNRAQEGLRVCEDLLRFCLERPDCVRRFRRLRHALATAARHLPGTVHDRLNARDSTRDAGRRFRAGQVRSIEHLLLINLQRTKEALRVLEEACRLVAPKYSQAFQRLRFQTYELERRVLCDVAAVRRH